MRSRPDGDYPVIVAEEDTTQCRKIVRYLQENDFRVLHAADADEAMALLRTHPEAQAFITDAHIPGKYDGYELARVMRERCPDMVVVMVSGHPDASSGPVPVGVEFVAKPYLLEHLAPTLRRLIEQGH